MCLGKFTLGVAYGSERRRGWSGIALAFEVDPNSMTVEGFVRHVRKEFKMTQGPAREITHAAFGLGIDENPKLIAQSKLMELNGKYIEIWSGISD